jgi:hypothetical protein
MVGLYKAGFFILFGINSLLILSIIFIVIDLLLDPAKKNSDAPILLGGGAIIAVGLFLAYQHGYSSGDFRKGLLILMAAFVVALVRIIVGSLFFSGPLQWH